ncbi:probable integral membrane protein NMA1898 [hydrothermal vent metagenome]|uniref:Probable integral membrane protein NMA1898 n=1 Tax=hydrothermal vent metagenome TaxID=652676 RepID=A0A1W1BN54_9ZZZZ
MSLEYPRFAVVGHPNKGKSSIVSTLAHDESVQISNIPGTTTKQRAFPLRIDGKILYELYDTPGFQRARATLAWLKAEDISAHHRPDRVKKFIYEHRDDARFHDEVELLEPIMSGAGIIYVVDGSKPYGVEYEAEMEILRWTGQPSMALINLIDDSNYVDEWKMALGQYFRLVRLFNPMEANFSQHIALLESMAQLKEEWTSGVKESIDIFAKYQSQKIDDSANLIAKSTANALSYISSLPISSNEATDSEKSQVVENYKEKIRSIENTMHQKIAKIWKHSSLDSTIDTALFLEMDLFSKESESLFGLSKRDMLIAGVTSGALTGSGIDLMVGGSSFMLGSAIGAIAGGVGVMLGYNEISDMKVLGQKLGSKRVEVGPMQNRNFPYILLRRTIYYTQEIANRPHANRADIEIESLDISKKISLNDDEKRELEGIYKIFRRGGTPKSKVMKSYTLLIRQILSRYIES